MHFTPSHKIINIGDDMAINKNDNKYIYVIVGQNIKRIRKERKMTQLQLANLIRYSEGTIANIENNSFQTFSLEFLYILAKSLNISMDEFFKGCDLPVVNKKKELETIQQ